MTSIERYNGNFIEYLNSEIPSGDPSSSFGFQNIKVLDLSLSCNIAVLPNVDSFSKDTKVDIYSEDPDAVKTSQDGDRLIVKQKEDSSNNIVINGNSISVSGSGVSIINGRVFQNGAEVDLNQKRQKPKPVYIVIHTQQFNDLIANLSGSSILASKVLFSKSKLKIDGVATVGIATKSLKLSLSGQGNSYCVLKGGDVDLKVSGQGSIRIKGEWNDLEASLSGMGQILTEGNCSGDYDASVSGMGSIVHTGAILGHKRKNVSGMGRISI